MTVGQMRKVEEKVTHVVTINWRFLYEPKQPGRPRPGTPRHANRTPPRIPSFLECTPQSHSLGNALGAVSLISYTLLNERYCKESTFSL